MKIKESLDMSSKLLERNRVCVYGLLNPERIISGEKMSLLAAFRGEIYLLYSGDKEGSKGSYMHCFPSNFN